jgi:hypothetical protein
VVFSGAVSDAMILSLIATLVFKLSLLREELMLMEWHLEDLYSFRRILVGLEFGFDKRTRSFTLGKITFIIKLDPYLSVKSILKHPQLV